MTPFQNQDEIKFLEIFSSFFTIVLLTSPLSATLSSANSLSDALHHSQMSSSSSLSAPRSSLSSSSSSSSSSSTSSSFHSSPQTSTGGELGEDEVMYHFYRNGRSRNDYRKASTAFMVSLFNDLQRGGGLSSGQHRTSQPLTDTIRSFSGTNTKGGKRGRKIISFYIPYLPQHERLRSAEIRFLRKPTSKATPKRFKFRISVRKSGKLINKFVIRQRSTPQYDYDVFDVTRIISPLINSYHGNISLHMRVSKKLDSQTLVALRDTSLRSTSLIVLYLEDREFLKNMYASYTSATLHETNSITDDMPPFDSSLPSRAKRSLPFSDSVFSELLSASFEKSRNQTNNTDIVKRTKRDSNKQRKRKSRKRRKWYRGGRKENCQMYDFEVDFNAIGWGQWIIHPKRFNSRFCFGTCPSPIDSKFQPTNHAMLQTLMKMKRPNIAPTPCCVPTKLNAISMLYFEYDEIVVRHHEDMVATQCGCR